LPIGFIDVGSFWLCRCHGPATLGAAPARLGALAHGGVVVAFAFRGARLAQGGAGLAELLVVGVRHITTDRRLTARALGQALATLSAGATSALLVVYIRAHLHAPPAGYGIALAAIGIGAAAGPLLLVRLIRDPTRAGWVFGPYAVRGGVDLTLAAVTTLPPAAVAVAAYGLGTSTGAVTFNSLLQATVPDTVRGRVMATFDLIWQAGRLASVGVGCRGRRPARRPRRLLRRRRPVARSGGAGPTRPGTPRSTPTPAI
jgi:hypothetical protein